MRVILSVVLSFVVVLAQADVSRWVDDNGNVHFPDTPRKAAGSQRVDVREINTAESVEAEPAGRDAGASDTIDVVWYSASWCGNCDRARAYFRENDIPFEEFDVEHSRKGRQDFAAMGGQAVPIILVGFSPARFERLYDT